jgi:hypothetical protein
MLKYRERLFGEPRQAAPLLDRELTWTEFSSAEARVLWRRTADRHVSTRGKEFGTRAAEGIVDAIYSVAAWLREEHRIPPDAARPPAQWRKALKEEWAQRTGKRRSRPHRPRHTAEDGPDRDSWITASFPARECGCSTPADASLDLGVLLAALTPEQHALLAAKINAPTGPGTGRKKKSPGPVRIPATGTPSSLTTSRERATGLEPATSSLGSWHSTN